MNSIINKLKLDEEENDKLKQCKNETELMAKLKTVEDELNKKIEELENQVDGQRLLDELHRYNEVKDAAQSLIGCLATIQGLPVAKIHQDLNLDMDS